MLSPGSRSAPLVIALERSEHIECMTITDERCAAFLCLGHSSSAGRSRWNGLQQVVVPRSTTARSCRSLLPARSPYCINR